MTSSVMSSGAAAANDPYRLVNGIHVPPQPVQHQEETYDSRAFDIVRDMQQRHFWYRGRHRFLLHAVRRHLHGWPGGDPRVVDLGGGCGGWLSYLLEKESFSVAEAGLADSSTTPLSLARSTLPESVRLFQIDLLNLQWSNRWDVGFLLDVLEHVPDHQAALRQIHAALAPGGFLFITVPAFPSLWSWNDDVVGHQRRYTKSTLTQVASESGFQVVDARYFMWLLSPPLVISRFLKRSQVAHLSDSDRWRLVDEMHQVPAPWVNEILATIFASETPLGHRIQFPWGTSLLAVLRKPEGASG